MTSAEETSFVPVGTVLAYAGCLTGPQLNEAGWAICDGRSFPQSNSELFDAIGTANGGDSQNFNLPELRGFFLRGNDPGHAVDQGPRYARVPGANSGFQVGSSEVYATARPTSSDSTFDTVVHDETSTHNSYAGTSAEMLLSGSEQVFKSDSGGDPESRPINAYVTYVIKTISTARLLPGMVVPFAGNDTTTALSVSYAFCNGWAFPREGHEEIYDALGPAHGTDGEKVSLPDYQGRFLRGVDPTGQNDPEAGKRTAMAPGGATGPAVGSIQDWATGRPTQNPFTLTIKLGTTEFTSDHCRGVDAAAWNSGAGAVDLTLGFMDRETRPVNIAVDYYVLCTAEKETDLFPIGGVIGFPGTKTPPSPDHWLVCNGVSLSKTDPKTAALFAAIGAVNGGDADHFNLPDYQGYFLRGRDHGTNRDPDVGGREARPGGLGGDAVGSVQGYATGQPAKRITASVAYLPPYDYHNAASWASNEVAAWDDPSVVKVGGGDAETRPLNAAVIFYIKYA